jgi:manganese oxidase
MGAGLPCRCVRNTGKVPPDHHPIPSPDPKESPVASDAPTTAARPSGVALGAIAVAVLAALLSIYALGVAFAAQTGSGSPAASTPGTAPPEVIPVQLAEFSFSPSPIQANAQDRLDVTNTGSAEHNLIVRGTAVGTSDLAPGATEMLDLSSLSPGTYEIFCDIPGHEGAGMVGSLTIGGEAADNGHGSHDTDSPYGSVQDMEARMAQVMAAFPAETEGQGAAPMEPEILEDGTKFYELVVEEIQWEVEPGKFVDALAYNGMVPGPTLRVDVGDRVTIRVTNNLPEEGTSLHPHGLRQHPFEIDGVTYLSQDPIAAGESMDHTFIASEPSVATYHSHHMAAHQIPDGLFGMLIVGDYAAMSGIDNIVAEEVMVLNDAGAIGLSLNGKSFPATDLYSYKQGDRVIVHYANEGLMPHPMHLHNQKGTVIARDGFMMAESARWSGDTFNIAPGERWTVVYEMDTPGVWVWHCHILTHVDKPDGTMFGMLTAVVVEPAE